MKKFRIAIIIGGCVALVVVPNISHPHHRTVTSDCKVEAEVIEKANAEYFHAGVLCAMKVWQDRNPVFESEMTRELWLQRAIALSSNHYPPTVTACLTNLSGQ